MNYLSFAFTRLTFTLYLTTPLLVLVLLYIILFFFLNLTKLTVLMMMDDFHCHRNRPTWEYRRRTAIIIDNREIACSPQTNVYYWFICRSTTKKKYVQTLLLICFQLLMHIQTNWNIQEPASQKYNNTRQYTIELNIWQITQRSYIFLAVVFLVMFI